MASIDNNNADIKVDEMSEAEINMILRVWCDLTMSIPRLPDQRRKIYAPYAKSLLENVHKYDHHHFPFSSSQKINL